MNGSPASSSASVSLLDLPKTFLAQLLKESADADAQSLMCCSQAAFATVIALQPAALALWDSSSTARLERLFALCGAGLASLLLPNNTQDCSDDDDEGSSLHHLPALHTAVLNYRLPNLLRSLSSAAHARNLNSVIICSGATSNRSSRQPRDLDLSTHLATFVQALQDIPALRHLVLALPTAPPAVAVLGQLTQLLSLRLAPTGPEALASTHSHQHHHYTQHPLASGAVPGYCWTADWWREGIKPLCGLTSLQLKLPLALKQQDDSLQLECLSALQRLEVELLPPDNMSAHSWSASICGARSARILLQQPGLTALQSLTRLALSTPYAASSYSFWGLDPEEASEGSPPEDAMETLALLPALASLCLTPHNWSFSLQQLQPLSACSKLTELVVNSLALGFADDARRIDAGNGPHLTPQEVQLVKAAVAAADTLDRQQQQEQEGLGKGSAGASSSSSCGGGGGGSSSSRELAAGLHSPRAAAAAAAAAGPSRISSRTLPTSRGGVGGGGGGPGVATSPGANSPAAAATTTYPTTVAFGGRGQQIQVPLLPQLRAVRANSLMWRLPLCVLSGRLEHVAYKRLSGGGEFGAGFVMPDIQAQAEANLAFMQAVEAAAAGAPVDDAMFQALQQQIQQQVLGQGVGAIGAGGQQVQQAAPDVEMGGAAAPVVAVAGGAVVAGLGDLGLGEVVVVDDGVWDDAGVGGGVDGEHADLLQQEQAALEAELQQQQAIHQELQLHQQLQGELQAQALQQQLLAQLQDQQAMHQQLQQQLQQQHALQAALQQQLNQHMNGGQGQAEGVAVAQAVLQQQVAHHHDATHAAMHQQAAILGNMLQQQEALQAAANQQGVLLQQIEQDAAAQQPAQPQDINANANGLAAAQQQAQQQLLAQQQQLAASQQTAFQQAQQLAAQLGEMQQHVQDLGQLLGAAGVGGGGGGGGPQPALGGDAGIAGAGLVPPALAVAAGIAGNAQLPQGAGAGGGGGEGGVVDGGGAASAVLQQQLAQIQAMQQQVQQLHAHVAAAIAAEAAAAGAAAGGGVGGAGDAPVLDAAMPDQLQAQPPPPPAAAAAADVLAEELAAQLVQGAAQAELLVGPAVAAAGDQPAGAAAAAAAAEAAAVVPAATLSDAPPNDIYADVLRGLRGLRTLDICVTALSKIMSLSSSPLANITELHVHMLGAVKLPPGGLPALARLHTVSFYLPAERNWEADYNDEEDLGLWKNQTHVRELIIQGTFHAGGFFAPGHLDLARTAMPHLSTLFFVKCADLKPQHLQRVVDARLCAHVVVQEGSNFVGVPDVGVPDDGEPAEAEGGGDAPAAPAGAEGAGGEQQQPGQGQEQQEGGLGAAGAGQQQQEEDDAFGFGADMGDDDAMSMSDDSLAEQHAQEQMLQALLQDALAAQAAGEAGGAGAGDDAEEAVDDDDEQQWQVGWDMAPDPQFVQQLLQGGAGADADGGQQQQPGGAGFSVSTAAAEAARKRSQARARARAERRQRGLREVAAQAAAVGVRVEFEPVSRWERWVGEQLCA